eukprot:1344968-Amphidinium_carterae.2
MLDSLLDHLQQGACNSKLVPPVTVLIPRVSLLRPTNVLLFISSITIVVAIVVLVVIIVARSSSTSTVSNSTRRGFHGAPPADRIRSTLHPTPVPLPSPPAPLSSSKLSNNPDSGYTTFGQPFAQSNIGLSHSQPVIESAVQPVGLPMGLPMTPNPWVEAAKREEEQAQVSALPEYTPSRMERRVNPCPMPTAVPVIPCHAPNSPSSYTPPPPMGYPTLGPRLRIVARRIEFYWS